ncbi:hypothetical protein P280DRAFT_420778 [Massarina eburnea CBS 473.64]|uniref:Uncharacterized protein n=1 Tax=Massarina eburnea CBS 473.64 TaxID=1395130 RepID=A0A6A6S8S3_9PLEO|nr:hypothetical protein P280DRAFT_420778 [Massarina eburnea CBS 473.64]
MKTTLILTALFTLALSAPTVYQPARRQNNAQSFTGALGGIAATPVLDSGDAKRPFSVKGDTFVNIGAALQRSCDQQFNACANAANGGDKTLSVSACNDQKTQCDAAGQTASSASAQSATGASNNGASAASSAVSSPSNAATGTSAATNCA